MKNLNNKGQGERFGGFNFSGFSVCTRLNKKYGVTENRTERI